MASMQFNTFGTCLICAPRQTGVACCGGDVNRRNENANSFLVPCPHCFLRNFQHADVILSLQTPLRMPETRLETRPKRRSTSVSNSAMVENVLPPLLGWQMIWTLSEFARPSRRISLVTVPFKRMRKSARLFSCPEINERM